MKSILFYQNINNSSPKWPPLRQTFLSKGIILNKEYRYILDANEKYEYFISIADGINPHINIKVPKEKRIIIMMENPSIWIPKNDYLENYGYIITPTRVASETIIKNIITHPSVNWFYGLKFKTDQGLSHIPILENYLELNDFAEMSIPKKDKLLSMVVSNKNGIKGHQWRVESALAVKKYFGDNIDMFGFGWNPIEDKKSAIDRYQYSIIIENESIDNYWTEKLSDSIIGYSMPIYFGAPNVQKYFEAEIVNNIYGCSENEFINIIKKILEKNVIYSDIFSIRQQILFEHNLFYHIIKIIKDNNM